MAARTSAGVGIIVTTTIFGVAGFAFLVLTLIFVNKYQTAKAELTQSEQSLGEIVHADERQREDVLTIKQAAGQEDKSVVGYLADSMKETMRLVTGSERDNVDRLKAKLSSVEGADTLPLLDVISSRDQSIASLSQQLGQANKDRTNALEDLRNESERVRNLTDSHQDTVDSLNGEVDQYKGEIEQYRTDLTDFQSSLSQRVDRIEQRAADEKDGLRVRIERLQEENLIMAEQIGQLRADRKSDLLKPLGEHELVDADVVRLSENGADVFIGIGSQQKVVLGMTFAVYNDAGAIRPNEVTGMYPRGKAEIEVVEVDEKSARCRVTWETRGNPIVRNDVVANAIYDPNKVYRFVVFGNFDANSDGRYTPQEKTNIEALIEEWNGEVSAELAGNVDFLVLGDRPVLPRRPRADDPFELVKSYSRLEALVNEYDDLFKRAAATSIPVLNQNRLFTLIGQSRGLDR